MMKKKLLAAASALVISISPVLAGPGYGHRYGGHGYGGYDGGYGGHWHGGGGYGGGSGIMEAAGALRSDSA